MATLAKTTRSTSYTLALASAGPFLVGYRLFDSDAVEVYVNGQRRTDWSLSATYASGFDDNATITFAAALDAGAQVVIETMLRPGRASNYTPGDPSLTANLNIELGRLWSAVADHDREIKRTPRIIGVEQDKLAPATGQFLTFASDGRLVPGQAFVNNIAATAYAQELFLAPDSVAARGILGLSASGDEANFSGVADGVTLNNAAILAAADLGVRINVPDGRFASSLTVLQLPKNMTGPGQMGDTNGFRAPEFVRQTAAPTSFGQINSVETRFNGDLSNVLYAGEKRITSAAAFGAPTTGYSQLIENSMFHLSALNVAGHNESLSGNGGRTGSSILDLRFQHSGQGDYGAIHISAITTAVKSGATSFLASPAAVMMNGELFSGAHGSYLNILELNANDLGFRTAAIGAVFNFTRTNAAATLGEVWMGVRPQSVSLASDVGYSLSGTWKRGLDLSAASLDGNAAAITIAQGQRIYMSSVASGDVAWSQTPGDDYLAFNGVSMLTVVNGASALQVNQNDVLVNTANGLTIAGTGALRVSGSFTTGSATATFTATNKPGPSSSGPTQWLRVVLNDFDFWIPCFPN
jgi:hypothetical protein